MQFVALDFETANYSPNSACAIGVVQVCDGEITARAHHLIRPPTGHFTFTHIHGITPADVQTAERFPAVWEQLVPLLNTADFFAAHNASFDARVLRACCEHYDIPTPRTPFRCTVRLARSALNIYPTSLPVVCQRLGIPLNHHQALSDAEACAKIVLHALEV